MALEERLNVLAKIKLLEFVEGRLLDDIILRSDSIIVSHVLKVSRRQLSGDH